MQRLPMSERFWMKVEKRGPDDCWFWKAAPRRKDQGYGAFWLEGRHQPSNKVAWILTHGDVQEGLHVCHSCDTPACCNPNHLFLGTNKQNNDDKVAKGRHIFGERVWTAKLLPDDVRFIRSHKAPDAKRAAVGVAGKLAEKFGVTKQYISEVWGNKSWRSL